MEGWSVDLITYLIPPTSDGLKHCIVAVDCFSKWVEIKPIADRTSDTLANWLYRDLIPRFGKPRWLRLDGGNEFKKTFATLCDDLGITRRVASTGRPQGNG